MDSTAEEKLQNMGEIVAVTAPKTIFCSGIDSAAKSKAWFDIKKSSEGVCKVSLDGAAPGCTLIQQMSWFSHFQL